MDGRRLSYEGCCCTTYNNNGRTNDAGGVT